MNGSLLSRKFSISSLAPKSILPKSSRRSEDLSFLEANDALEIARQITLMEFEIFEAIKPRELIDLNWKDDDKKRNAPNLIKLSEFHDHIVHWLATEIVKGLDAKQRVRVMESIIMLGSVSFYNIQDKNFEQLHNFNGVQEVVSAFQNAAIESMKKTFGASFRLLIS